MPSLAVCCGDRVRGPLRTGLGWCHPALHCQTQPGSGTPISTSGAHLLPRALTSTPGCPQGPSPAPQDPDLHPSTSPRRHCQLLSTCICIPTLSCAPLDTPRDTCKPPQDPQPCPRHPPLHSGITPGTLTCTSGPTPAPHNTLRDPIASQDPSQCPTRDPCQLPSTFICTPGPPGDLCQLLISTPVPPSPPQVPTSSPDTLTPSPRNTHPSSWTLTPSPGLSPWMFLFPPSTPAGSGSLRSREVGFD